MDNNNNNNNNDAIYILDQRTTALQAWFIRNTTFALDNHYRSGTTHLDIHNVYHYLMGRAARSYRNARLTLLLK